MNAEGSGLERDPPIARRAPGGVVVRGQRREDPYAWLRARDDLEVRRHLEQENAYADRVMRPTTALQDALYREMLGRIKEDDTTVPFLRNGYFYYSRTEQGLQYPIHCRRAGRLDAAEEVLLDLNRLAEGHAFVALGALTVNDAGDRLAYTIDVTGAREYTLHVKDLASDTLGPERIEHVAGVAWSADPAVLFYVTENEAKRPCRLWRHRLGAAHDELVYEETDALFRLHVERSRSRRWLFAVSGSFTSTEARGLPADRVDEAWRVILPREPDHEYEVDHGVGPEGERFYIRTNGGGRRNFRLVTAPVDDPRPARWTELLPHRDSVMLEGVDVFAGHWVAHEREDGLLRFRVTRLGGDGSYHLAFPEPAYEVTPEGNAEFVTHCYRFRYQSFVTPASVFDEDVRTRERTLLKRTAVLGDFDPERYAVERLHATAPDGTRVPISLVRRREAPRDGSGALLLSGYGAYGIPYPVTFSSSRLSLLDRGVTVAIAHVRGGGELGKCWHDEGRMLAKRNTFTDFLACADFLVTAGYASRARLAVEGGSAGGLLVGAALNLRPDLCRAAVLRVPFVDVVNTMLDESLPLTIGEFEEWGNPQDPVAGAYLDGYCPYTNLAAGAYPAMLVRTSLHDSQVMFWEPAKYVAKLRTLKTDDRALLLKVDLDSGHTGASGRYDALRELAFDYAFVLTQLGCVG